MLKTLKRAFQVKEIRSKIYFTLAILLIVRIGSQLPVPGIEGDSIADFLEGLMGGSFLDAFTGGSLTQMSVFALNITPYITSSIIMQLMTIAIPKLEEMQKDGEDGRKKIAAITRYVTVGLALIESSAMAYSFDAGNAFAKSSTPLWLTYITVIACLTAGSSVIMWLGERITEKGVGNGISIILVINIISRIPSDFATLYNTFMSGKIIPVQVVAAAIILAVVVGMVIIVVLLNGGVRKIPVQYAKKIAGRKMVGGQASNIPLKVNTAGVMPIIFASSILQFPVVLNNFFHWWDKGIAAKIMAGLNSNNWCNPKMPIYSIGLLIYIGLLIFFAYFYTSISFNPIEIANNLKQQGGFIPGIRPGTPTSEYLTMVVNRIIFIGAVGLIIVSVIPFIFSGVFGAEVSFGGTSLIIIVSVVLETMKQIESLMLVRNYKGFLND